MDEPNTSLIVHSDSSLEISEEHIDTSTVIPRTQLERLMDKVRDHSSHLPIHLQQLESLPYPDELKKNLVSAYSNEAQKLARYMNKEVEVLGMVIWEIPPYMSRPANKGDAPQQKPGFFQVRILTSLEDENGNYIVLRSSSVGIATVCYFAIKNGEAWLFGKPVMYRFSETNGGQHTMLKCGESLRELKDLIRKGKSRV